MKFRKILFWSCMLIFFGAGAKSEMPSSNGQRVILTQEKSNKNRPKAPSRVWVECEYGEGFVSFSFPGDISSYTVHMYNDTDEWYGFVSKEEPTVSIPLFVGSYTVECTSDDGRIFTGIIEF